MSKFFFIICKSLWHVAAVTNLPFFAIIMLTGIHKTPFHVVKFVYASQFNGRRELAKVHELWLHSAMLKAVENVQRVNWR